ncbi:UDP-N-acetylglucosamine transferase subunit ALG14 homolog isoform X2 [Sitophilus oryzae]|nr:UDP-N-acetylglucosamine transferase subunit ALG14 homolog isoform X2 [Sitophilus oryzae]
MIHKITTGSNLYAPKRSAPCKTAICIGSGGHTTEMLKLIENISFQHYNPRYYFISSSDKTSLRKVTDFESDKSFAINKDYFICYIPRSRAVNQSYISSVFTTLISVFYSFPHFLKIRPDMLLCNGPGTCIPLCIISFVLKCCFICNTRIIFIESFCRTKSFSLTGKILIYIADNFLVQWPYLKIKLKRSEYIGQLL